MLQKIYYDILTDILSNLSRQPFKCQFFKDFEHQYLKKMKKSLISVISLKELRKSEKISKEEYHNKIVDLFIRNLDFNCSEVIGRGPSSTVLRIWNKNAPKGFAVKIKLKEDIGPVEKEWSKLHHKNILILLDTEDFPVFDLTWFLSPMIEITLEKVLKTKVLQNEPIAFQIAVSWIKEITSALDYLHTKELSFFNLKLSNVMICEDQSIKLFGFHRLNKIGQFTMEYDMPVEYQPPESYSAECRRLPVEGKAFDLWCLGVLSVEVFTRNYLSRNKPNVVYCWNDGIYPKLFQILKKNNFNTEFQCAFPNCNTENKTLKIVRNFLRACLRFLPESRPSAGVLLHHKLLENRGLLAEKDKIWKKQLKPRSIRHRTQKMNFLFDTTGPTFLSVTNQTHVHEIVASNIHKEGSITNNEGKNILETKKAIMLVINNDNTENEEVTDIKIIRTSKKEVASKTNVPEIYAYNTENTHNHINEAILNVNLLNEMFGRIVLLHYRDNLMCRLLHTKSVIKALRSFLKCERNFTFEQNYAEGTGNDKSFSSRINSIGYKVASKIFQNFI